jgi:glucosamine--fructose-6-phosphate aminotransferase (isomerizing)
MGRVQEAHVETVAPTPAPHPHWTIKECLQQPEAIARALAYGSRFADEKVILGGLDRNKEKLQQVRNLLISACGTSLYASMYGARIMRELGAFDTAVAMDAAELALTDIPKHSGGLLVVSQSGETRDVMNSIKKGEVAGVPRLSVVNVVGSAIARETKLGVYMHAGREQAVASTKAFTGQVTVLSLLALWFRQLREEEGGVGINMPDKSNLLSALQRLPISFGMAMGVRSRCKEIAAALLDADHCFVLGKGYATPVALEGALKLKEMAYLHAEGYSGGALKHGPFALIEGAGSGKRATPIIMLILDDEHANHMRTAAQEVRARGAQVFVITDNPKLAEGIDNKPVVIPSNNELTALIGVLPLQLIAYELAVLKGIDPDTPRNLAKAVTTD